MKTLKLIILPLLFLAWTPFILNGIDCACSVAIGTSGTEIGGGWVSISYSSSTNDCCTESSSVDVFFYNNEGESVGYSSYTEGEGYGYLFCGNDC